MAILEEVFEGAIIPQLVLSPTGVIHKANRQLLSLMGLDQKELVEADYKTLIFEEDQKYLESYLKEGLSQGQLKVRLLKKDKAPIWVLIHINRLTNGVYFLQVQDLTEQKNVELALQQKAKDLEQFVYIASHDLREPLTTIAGFSSLLSRRCSKTISEEGSSFLKEILNTTKRMESKIDDLLAFSRAGRILTAKSTCFPLELAIEDAKRFLTRAILESKAGIEVEGVLPTVYGDKSLIAQVFQNLLANSIKYRGPKAPKIRICVTPEEFGFCQVSLMDNGIGFDMHHKDRIFTIFQRLHTIEEYPGSGVGLAIAKRIIESHQGRIWAESRIHQGSTFFFTLPTAQV